MSERNLITDFIGLTGQVVDSSGNYKENITVTFDNGAEIYNATIEDNGRFTFENLPRSNGWLTLSHQEDGEQIIAVHLHHPAETEEVILQPIKFPRKTDSQTNFLFAGDTAFGRRFVNPTATGSLQDEDRYTIPLDNSEALIKVSEPELGAISAVSQVKPVFEIADYSVVNFESVITNEPATPHPYKDKAFYSLPGTLDALTYLGVDYVSLGNNHAFDYLEKGIIDTLGNLDAVDIKSSGVGLTPGAAFRGYRQTLNEHAYSFLSFSSIRGDRNEPPFPLYVATDEQGGAADFGDTAAVKAAISQEIEAGYSPIVQLHTGREYFASPDEATLEGFQLAVDAGAKLVIGHHPHVAQGFDIIDGVPIVHSLGNFAFDQSRLETQLSMMVQVEMDEDRVTQLTGIPIYIQDFQPRLITGDLANRYIRQIAEQSSVIVYPYNYQAVVSLADDDYQTVEREIDIPVTIPSSGKTIVDLTQYFNSTESLAYAEIDGEDLKTRQGRDLLMFGGMEETDLDGDDFGGEISRWKLASEAFSSSDRPHSGAVALYSQGNQSMAQDSVYFSTTASEPLKLLDSETSLNSNEIVQLEPANSDFRLYGLPDIGSFTENIDAFYLHSDEKISFSSSRDFDLDDLGRVADGSVVTYDPQTSAWEILIAEKTLFPDRTDIDLDAFHLNADGTVYFSTNKDGILNNLSAESLFFKDGDIIEYDPNTNLASILVAEDDLFANDVDINSISWFGSSEILFSTTARAELIGENSLNLVDGAIAAYNLETKESRPYLLQSELFSATDFPQADLNALHVKSEATDELLSNSESQISFRNRIRVEGNSANQPNTDLTVFGYLHQENSGSVAITAEYYASQGNKQFGREVVHYSPGGTTADRWQSFARDLDWPEEKTGNNPLTDEARSLRLFVNHQAAEESGLVGIDDVKVLSWQDDSLDLSQGQSFSTPHNLDFLEIEGAPGDYTLNAIAKEFLPY